MHPDSPLGTTAHPSLDYLQPSPVRGQLEPHDELTRKSGCRFLQCTDTPNELKVLLPPRTAQIYDLLLKAELAELGKHHDASWDRILDIRRLKDRMIRKCLRLAKTHHTSNPGAHVPFLTLHAPSDFRVKEIEKWIRLQEGADALKKLATPDTLRQRGSFCCDRCANLVPHHHTVSSRRSAAHSTHSRRLSVSEKSPSKAATLSRRPSVSTSSIKGAIPTPPSPIRPVMINTIQRTRDQELRSEEHTTTRTSNRFQEDISSRVVGVAQERTEVRTPRRSRSSSIDSSRSATEARFLETKRSMHTITEDSHELSSNRSVRSLVEDQVEVQSEVGSLARLSIISPDPIPVPYHGSTSAAFMEICDSPVDATHLEANKPRQRNSSVEDSTPSPPSEEELNMGGSSQLGLPRRRSSLKRSNSELRMSMAYSTKTVSWAMDRDWAHQMTKYHAAAAQMDNANEEWDSVCQKYEEELAGLRVLRRNVAQTLSKLRTEADKLQREDEVIRDQEEKLRQGYEQLREKHGEYCAKVKAVLQETEQVLSLCGTKRDGELRS